MPLNKVRFQNGTGTPVTFRLELTGTGGSRTVTRTIPGGPPTEPIDPALDIHTVLSTSNIKGSGLPSPLVLANTVTDHAMVEATARANSTTHGRLTTVGGSNPSEDYLPTMPAEAAAAEPEVEQPPQPPT